MTDVRLLVTLLHDAALLATAAGIVAAAASYLRTRRLPVALTVLLDMFSAASLLRLAGPPTWSSILTASLTIVIRQLASRGLRPSARRPRATRRAGGPARPA